MTRGMKGCYVYFVDSEMASYAKSLLSQKSTAVPPQFIIVPELKIETDVAVEARFKDYLPYYSIRAACGYFGEGEEYSEEGWIRADNIGRLNRNMFVVRACGKSMEPRIHDGDYCVFSRAAGGSREGKIVLVQHYNDFDPDYSGSFSIKQYHSVKSFDENGGWQHEKLEFRPLNADFQSIVIKEDGDEDNFVVVGEFIGIIPSNPNTL